MFQKASGILVLLILNLILSGCNPGQNPGNLGIGNDLPNIIDSLNCKPITFEGLASTQTLSQNKVNLKFDPATGGSGNFIYRVYVDETLFTITTNNPAAGQDGKISIMVNSLDPSTTYNFSLKAFDGCSEDTNTASSTATTSNSSTIPAQPVFGGVANAQPEGGAGIRLSWSGATDDRTAVSNIDYKIYRSTMSLGYDFSNPLATLNNTLSYLDDTAQVGITYFYTVRAFDEDGNHDGNFGERQVKMLTPILFGGIVSGLTAAHDKITIKFAPALGGSGTFIYRVYLNGNLSNPYTTAAGLSAGTDGLITLTVPSLTIASTYSFIVRAFDGNNEDPNFTSLNLSTFAFTVPTFAGVSQLQTQPGVNGKTGIVVNWNQATAASGTSISSYSIYTRAANQNFNFNNPVSTVSGVSLQAQINGLSAGATYYVNVRARGSNGIEESNQVELSITTNSAGTISFAGAQTVVPATGTDGFSKAVIYWTTGTGDYDHYQIFVSTTDPSNLPLNDSFWSAPHTTVFDLSRTNRTISGLNPRTTYFFVVRAAFSEDNTSDQNRTARSTVIQAPPAVFAGASSISQPSGTAGLTSLTVNWLPATGAFNQYRIFQKSAGSYNFSGSPAGVVDASSTSFTINGLTTGTEACFVVRAIFDGVTPISSDTNLNETCGTPTATPPVFAGLASCAASTVVGEGTTTLRLGWAEATGAFDTYAIWYSTSPTINFASNPTEIISEGLLAKPIYNLIPNTTYYVAMRARYSVTNTRDTNTVIRSCKTNKAFATFTQLTNGIKGGSNSFLTSTRVCVQDSLANNVSFDGNITLSLETGPGTLGGTLTRSMVSGCATFSDLTYTSTGTMTLRASATYAVSSTSNTIVAVNPDVTPPGACANQNTSWFTAYGGCYSPSTNLVVSAQGANALNTAAHVWTAASNLTGIDLHEWSRDGNGDGRPDQWGVVTGGSWTFDYGTNGYCRDLVEGGYGDWRIPTWEDAIALTNVSSYSTSWSFNPNTQRYYYIGRASLTGCSSCSHRLDVWDYTNRSITWAESNYRPFCVRTAESTFVLPSMNGDLAATVPNGAAGAGQIDLTWSAATGSYTGYYVYWAPTANGINYSTPQRIVRNNVTSLNVTGLNPGTDYSFAIRPVWTNSVPEIIDANTTVVTATTRTAYLSLTRFNGIPLSNGRIPVIVSVLESTTNAVVNTAMSITVSQLSGTGSLGGTTTVSATNGVAFFNNLTYSDTSSSGNLRLSISSALTPTITTPVTTIAAIDPGSCKAFNTSIYPMHGGCFFSALNLVTSAVNINNYAYWYQVVWESGPSPAFLTKEASDTSDGDGDGLFDDIDSTSIPGTNPGYASGGFCHNLVEGGRTDWRVPTLAHMWSLNNLTATSFGSMVAGTNYWTGQITQTSTYAGIRFSFPGTIISDGYWGYVFCVRTP